MPSATAIPTALALLLAAGSAFGQDKPTIALQVDSTCPNRALVEAALVPLLRDYQLRDDASDNVAQIRDLGESYSVTVNGAAREVRDPERQCLERARVTAVFVMLNLPPATTAGSTEASKIIPAEESPPAPTPPPIVPRLPARPRRQLLLRAFAQVESAPGADLSATGVGGGATWQWGQLGVSLLGAFATPTEPDQADGEPSRVRLWRIPCSLLLGWEAPLGLVGVALEAGPALDVLRFEGQRVPNASGGSRLNLGLRANAALRVHASRRLQADLSPGFAYFPRTYLARVDPSLVVAETPRWWLGISLGLHFRCGKNEFQPAPVEGRRRHATY